VALATALFQVGQTNDSLGLPNLNRSEPALAAFEEAGAVMQGLQEEGADKDGLYLRRLSALEDAKACVYMKRERVAEAEVYSGRSAELSRRALQATPQPDSARLWAHAIALNNHGYLQLRLGDRAGAIQSAAEAFALVDRLARENPGVAVWVPRRRIYQKDYGLALAAGGRCADALVHLGETAGWLRERLQQKESPVDSKRLALSLIGQAKCLPASGRAAEALAAAREAEARLAQLAEKEPKDRELLLCHGEALTALAALVPARRAALLEQARGRYAAAQALQPLAADNERDYRDVLAALAR
jgi:tetratricopeptide (TPR) repeat protein